MIVKWYSGAASLYREIFLISEKIRPRMLLVILAERNLLGSPASIRKHY